MRDLERSPFVGVKEEIDAVLDEMEPRDHFRDQRFVGKRMLYFLGADHNLRTEVKP